MKKACNIIFIISLIMSISCSILLMTSNHVIIPTHEPSRSTQTVHPLYVEISHDTYNLNTGESFSLEISVYPRNVKFNDILVRSNSQAVSIRYNYADSYHDRVNIIYTITGLSQGQADIYVNFKGMYDLAQCQVYVFNV